MILASGIDLSVTAACYMLPSDFKWNYNEPTGGEPQRGPGEAARGAVTPISARKPAGTGAVNRDMGSGRDELSATAQLSPQQTQQHTIPVFLWL